MRDEKITVNDASVERTIVLKQPQIITGRVIDARTKQPIPEFIVERAFEDVAGHPDGLYWATRSDQRQGWNLFVRSDDASSQRQLYVSRPCRRL